MPHEADPSGVVSASATFGRRVSPNLAGVAIPGQPSPRIVAEQPGQCGWHEQNECVGANPAGGRLNGG